MTAEPTGQGSPDLPAPSETEAGLWRAESWLGPPRQLLLGLFTACRLEAQKQVQERERERERSRRTSKQGLLVHYLHPEEKDGSKDLKFINHNYPKVTPEVEASPQYFPSKLECG